MGENPYIKECKSCKVLCFFQFKYKSILKTMELIGTQSVYKLVNKYIRLL